MSDDHAIVGHDAWLTARRALLAREKELTRLRDEVSRERRELPWEAVEKDYAFDTELGQRTLAELFGGRNELVVYHFMFAPEDEAGCPHCSFWADSFDSNTIHLAAKGVAFAAVSRAPLAKLLAYRERMGWSFDWVSSAGSDFNYDLGVSFRPAELDQPLFNFGTMAPHVADREGASVFARDESGRVFRTYSTYGRGIDLLNAAYNYIDLTPSGRDEQERGNQYWVRRHDEY